MEVSKYALLFPAIEGDDLESFEADVLANGVINPVLTYEGQVLDGRNRWEACERLGLDCPVERIEDKDWFDESTFSPYTYVASLNFSRRHLTQSQKAMVSADLARIRMEDARSDLMDGETAEEARKAASDAVGVSESYTKRAQYVDDVDKDLADEVRRGETSVSAAYKEARLQAQESELPTNSEISQEYLSGGWTDVAHFVEQMDRKDFVDLFGPLWKKHYQDEAVFYHEGMNKILKEVNARKQREEALEAAKEKAASKESEVTDDSPSAFSFSSEDNEEEAAIVAVESWELSELCERIKLSSGSVRKELFVSLVDAIDDNEELSTFKTYVGRWFNSRNKSVSRPADLDEVNEYGRELWSDGKYKEYMSRDENEAFFDYYTGQGWKLSNKNPIKDWKACFRRWYATKKRENGGSNPRPSVDNSAIMRTEKLS